MFGNDDASLNILVSLRRRVTDSVTHTQAAALRRGKALLGAHIVDAHLAPIGVSIGTLIGIATSGDAASAKSAPSLIEGPLEGVGLVADQSAAGLPYWKEASGTREIVGRSRSEFTGRHDSRYGEGIGLMPSGV